MMDPSIPSPFWPESLHTVLIGGSAGALDALRTFFQHQPARQDLAFVVVQHLNPSWGSQLDALLCEWTPMPVALIGASFEPMAGHVYLVPPGQALEFQAGRLVCRPAVRRPGQVPRPIDASLQALAACAGPRVGAIILSGTLDDGAAGVRHVHQAGGFCMVQDPNSTEYAGMPEAAIATGCVDAILPVAHLPGALDGWLSGPREVEADPAMVDDDACLSSILELVRQHTHNDLSGYKLATLRRRIDRRMGLNRLPGLTHYLKLLQEHPAELDRLAKDLIIGVTSFFRDREAFELLNQEVMPALLNAIEPEQTIRVWVAGCSTGEEAYSVAMLLHQAFVAKGEGPRVQIFATDIDLAALEVARSGVYSREAADAVPATLLESCFEAAPEGVKIRKVIRDSIVFASHNLISDPPFSRLDLVVCRNVLIYLNATTQKKLLSLFRFVLKQGGYLFLGNSESPGTAEKHFQAVSKTWRIYQMIDPVHPKQPPALPFTAPGMLRRLPGGAEISADLGAVAGQEMVYRQMIERHGPALVLVDSQLQVQYVSGNARPFLEFPAGSPTQDLVKIIRPDLRVALRASLNQALRSRVRSVAHAVPATPEEGNAEQWRLTATPVLRDGVDTHLLITLEEEPAQQSILPLGGQGGDAWLLQQMEQELNATREDLQRTVERMRILNEEGRAANEEIMAMNEELQSANEELESSKEELQSLNEELAASNNALDAKVYDLENLNSDLNNLLVSSDTATMFLDRGLRIRRFTDPCTRLMRVIPADVGRPLGDLVQDFTDPSLQEDCRRVLDGAAVAEHQIQNGEGRWFLRRVLPYRSIDGRIEGLVLTFPEITTIKESEQKILHQKAQLEWQAELLRDAPVLARDTDDRILFWNPGTQALYGWSADEALGQVSHELLASRFPEPQEDIKRKVRETGRWHGRIVHTCKDGSEVLVNSDWIQKTDPEGTPTSIVEINADVTWRVGIEEELAQHRSHLEELVAEKTRDLHEARQAAELASQAKSAFLANMSHEIRTPLSAIVGLAHLVRRSDLSADQQELLDKLEAAGTHLLDMLSSVLDLAKIEAGKVTVEMAPLNVADLVAKVVAIQEDRAKDKNLDLAAILEIPRNDLAGDRVLLQQALLNLVANAIKFTESGAVEVRAALLEEDERACLIRFEVRDTGPGIPEEILPRLFSPFEQGDGSITRRFGGTGLGLAITQRIADAHGGGAGAESVPGTGSTVWFTARMEKGHLAAPPTHELPPEQVEARLKSWTHKARILVVEDEELLREVTPMLLAVAGLTAQVAKDGQDAVDLAARTEFDLILMDMQMPIMDGLEATRRIRQIPGRQKTPIVAMTGNAFGEDRQRCLEAGMDDYLVKPFTPNTLFPMTLKWLEAGAASRA